MQNYVYNVSQYHVIQILSISLLSTEYFDTIQ